MPSKSNEPDFFKRALHRIIARHLDVEMIEHARQVLKQWNQTPDPQPVYIDAWHEILKQSPAQIAQAITAPTERMDQWRSSSPFKINLLIEDRLRLAKAAKRLASRYGYIGTGCAKREDTFR